MGIRVGLRIYASEYTGAELQIGAGIGIGTSVEVGIGEGAGVSRVCTGGGART